MRVAVTGVSGFIGSYLVRRLAACGVEAVTADGSCTFADRERFYSFRRDGQCGRMAALIWMAA